MLARALSPDTRGLHLLAPRRSQVDFLAVQGFALTKVFGADAAGIKSDQLIEFSVGEASGIKLSREKQKLIGLFLDLTPHPAAKGIPE